jgi:hypothetical protein
MLCSDFFKVANLQIIVSKNQKCETEIQVFIQAFLFIGMHYRTRMYNVL